jgi:hypothetical protein
MNTRWIFLGALGFASGCASIMDGTTQTVSFHSNPEGATVRVDGTTLGVTPLAFQLKKSTYHQVNFSKDGFKPLTLPLDSRLDGFFWGNIVLGGAIGSTTDLANGAANEYSPNQFVVSLEPLQANRLNRETLKGPEQKAREFIVLAYSSILTDLTRGQGDYLHSLMGVLGIPIDQQPDAVKKIRALSEAYTNILEFADHTIELYLKPLPSNPGSVDSSAPSKWENIKAGQPDEQFNFLIGVDQFLAGDYIQSLTEEQRKSLTDYILDSKGTKSSRSWGMYNDISLEFSVSPTLNENEKVFVLWFIKKFTTYKPI